MEPHWKKHKEIEPRMTHESRHPTTVRNETLRKKAI